MITCRALPDHGYVEIAFTPKAEPLYGASVTYATDGVTFQPCAVYPGDADHLIASSLWEWNQAVEFGRLQFNGAARTVCWHRYLNGMHGYAGPVTLRVDVLREDGLAVWETTLALSPARAVYLDDWPAWVTEGWTAEGGLLAVRPGVDAPPLRVPLGVAGCYDVYLGLGYGTFMAHLKVSSEPNRYPFIAERNRPEFQDKGAKELRWKTVELQPGDALEIAPLPLTVRQPETWPFGALRYIKLVPSTPAPALRAAHAEKPLALYFEPYSWAFVYHLHDRWRVREALALFREMGGQQVHTQVLRFGSKTMHYSRVVERHDSGALMGDDGTFSPGPAQCVRALDVLRESIDISRELGMTHYANAALSNCYPGTDFEERISREHPEWRTHGVLRYHRPETIDYAAAVIREFVAWGTDGVSIDCLRYPYHHTEEELLAFFHAIAVPLRERQVPLTARIPAGDTRYFRVFDRLVRDGLVQCIVPSTLFMREPQFSLKPYRQWQDRGCRVFGIIDGWLSHIGSFGHYQFSLYRNPTDIRADITRFFREGADGIFVYQADLHCADPFTREVLDWRRWLTVEQEKEALR